MCPGLDLIRGGCETRRSKGLTMYRLGPGSKHHVSLGCQIMLLQLLHQEFDRAGGLGGTPCADGDVTAQPAALRLVL